MKVNEARVDEALLLYCSTCNSLNSDGTDILFFLGCPPADCVRIFREISRAIIHHSTQKARSLKGLTGESGVLITHSKQRVG